MPGEEAIPLAIGVAAALLPALAFGGLAAARAFVYLQVEDPAAAPAVVPVAKAPAAHAHSIAEPRLTDRFFASPEERRVSISRGFAAWFLNQ
jgi:hypothetical protein